MSSQYLYRAYIVERNLCLSDRQVVHLRHHFDNVALNRQVVPLVVKCYFRAVTARKQAKLVVEVCRFLFGKFDLFNASVSFFAFAQFLAQPFQRVKRQKLRRTIKFFVKYYAVLIFRRHRCVPR